MRSEQRNVGVTAAFLFVLAVAGFAVLHLVGGLPSRGASPSADARPTPVQARPQDGVFEPIPLEWEDAASDSPSAETTAAGYARIRELEQGGDVNGLAAFTLAPLASDGLSEDQLQHERRLRVTALHALANVGGQRAVATLCSVLEDFQQELVLRLAAAAALARTGGEAELAYLRARLEAEPSNVVREKIRLALERRGASSNRG